MKINSQNLTDKFESLWKKYTTDRAVDHSLGFIHSGGDSVLALQFTTELEDLCPVPEDFIAFLLSNRSYLDCFKLIENRSYQRTENNTSRIPQIKMKRDVFQAESSLLKKPKISNYAKAIQIKGKNFNENYGFCENVIQPPIDLKIKWKYDLEKCVDASPTLVIFEE